MEDKDLRDIIYVGLFADGDGKRRMREFVMNDVDFSAGGWDVSNILEYLPEELGVREYFDHVTLAFHSQGDNPLFGDVMDFYRENKGKPFDVNVTRIGVNPSMTAVALGVDLGKDIPCCNANPHITAITMNGGKPFESNNIREWQPLDKPFPITLVCDAFLRK